MKRVVIVFTLLAAFFTGWGAEAFAEGKIKPFASVRYRWEADNRDFDSNTAYITYAFLRSRLGMKYQASDDIEGVILLQDTRLFGSEANTIGGSAKLFDLREGYFKVKDFFKAPIDLKIGRMRVNYGVQRLVGAVEWSNIGRSFDGVVVDIHGDKWWLDLFNHTVRDSLFRGDYKDIYFYGAYANIKAHENHPVQVFAMWQRSQPRSVLNRGTIGAHLKGNFGGFSYESDLAYQFGDINTSASPEFRTGVSYLPIQQTVEAYMLTLKLGYAAKETKAKPAVFAAVEFLSGDDDLEDDKYKVFSTLYATNHKFYGYMDYFLAIPLNTFGRGLVDMWGRVQATPLKKTKMQLDFHYFQAAKDVFVYDEDTDVTTNAGTAFGSEVDFVVNHNYTDSFSFQGGASWFGPGDVFKAVRGTDGSTWFYIQATFKI
jgi:hypothetical protein